MGSRYNERRIFKNELEIYDSLFKERGVEFIRHYATPSLRYPTVSDLTRLTRIRHVWKTGDRFYKLAAQYYTQPQYWWVIARFNQAPTESHLIPGEVIRIPMPLERVLSYYNRD